MHQQEHEAEHDDIQAQFRRILSDQRVPLDDRFKMSCAFGAAFGGIFFAGDAFAEVPSEEMGAKLRAVVHRLLT